MLAPEAGVSASERPECGSSSSRLTREQVVDRIITLNPSATVAFLERFRDESLTVYLAHLVEASTPRGARSRWVRPGDSPAIVVRVSGL